MFEKLEFLDVSQNELRGLFPKHLPSTLLELWLERNGARFDNDRSL